jgi:hypothetical protein
VGGFIVKTTATDRVEGPRSHMCTGTSMSVANMNESTHKIRYVYQLPHILNGRLGSYL